jgi:hypothetical protein
MMSVPSHISLGRAWYREPWVWLLILVPATAVIGSLFTIYLAVTTNDGLVVDDYYQKGKEINLVLARDRAASVHGLDAVLDIDLHEQTATLRMSAQGYTLPEAIVLEIVHPTRAHNDHRLALVRVGDGYYRARVPSLLPGRWYVQLEADDWRLFSSVKLPMDSPAHVVPREGDG